MTAWWENLAQINQAFYGVALFFSVFFIWQLISAIIGLDGDDGEDGSDGGDMESDGADTTVAFRVLSIRSIITFCTLFSWGGALYLNNGKPLANALGLSAIWGLAGMFSVALVFWGMRKMIYTGTMKLSSCVGIDGTVYLDIPEKGFGEVKLIVSGVMTHVKARSKNGIPLSAQTPVRVTRIMNQTSVEVDVIGQ